MGIVTTPRELVSQLEAAFHELHIKTDDAVRVDFEEGQLIVTPIKETVGEAEIQSALELLDQRYSEVFKALAR